VLSCYDRVVITGTVPVICYAEGMTRFLYASGIRIFDYPQFAQTLRDRVRDRAAALASDAGLTIEHIARSHIRKEEVVARVLAQRGDHFYKSALAWTLRRVDAFLIRWARSKFKRLRLRPRGAREWFSRVVRDNPKLFAHWGFLNVSDRTSGAV
jgi:hypothetical protein